MRTPRLGEVVAGINGVAERKHTFFYMCIQVNGVILCLFLLIGLTSSYQGGVVEADVEGRTFFQEGATQKWNAEL